MQTVTFSERRTKYHNEATKVAVVNIPGKGSIELALSDTQRCARMKDAAQRTVKNLAGDALSDDEAMEAGDQLHAHCRRMLGIHEDPAPRRG